MSSLLDILSQILALPGLEKEVSLSMRQKVSDLFVEILKNKILSQLINALSPLFSRSNLMRVTLGSYAIAINGSPITFKLFISLKMSEQKISQLKMATEMVISPTTLGRYLDVSKEETITVNLGLDMMSLISLTPEERYWGLALLFRDNRVFEKLNIK